MYVAADGTEFKDKKQCLIYEESAKCVLEARLNRCLLKKGTAKEVLGRLGREGEGCTCYAVRPVDKEDIENINMFCNLYDNRYMVDLDESSLDHIIIIMIDEEYDHYWTCSLTDIVKNIEK